MKVVVLGLSLSSSWGNGHATTYRALLRAMAARGHDILFLEADRPWYAAHRDFVATDYCTLAFYETVADLRRFVPEITQADACIVGSYVPDGIAVIDDVQSRARGVTAFYDIDTPISVAALADDTCAYLARRQVSGFDAYFSFTGGPMLRRLETEFGARAAHTLYCCADALPSASEIPRYDLGYLGTYSADRQPTLQALLLDVALARPGLRCVVAGPQYPEGIAWPANVERVAHVPPADHPAFFRSLRWTLNVTRADMRAAGHSPSVRLFEAAAAGTPIITDRWDGIGEVFAPDTAVVIADTAADVLAALDMPEPRRAAVGDAGRGAIIAGHSPAHRAADLERALRAAAAARRRAA